MKRTTKYLILFLTITLLGGLFLATYHFSSAPKNPLPADVATPVETEPAAPPAPVFHYIEIMNACDHAFEGSCVNVRSGPGTSYASVLRLRNGVVLKVEDETVSGEGHDWYKVVFDKEVRYPERVTSKWYVAAEPDSVREFEDVGELNLDTKADNTTKKYIIVDISKQILYAYEGDDLFMEESISTGVEINPTPIGKYTIYKKTPSRYMQGPLPDVSDEYYDLPGVAWDLYFTKGGAVLHSAYWHDNFGQPMSHGCVNQSPENAKKLYEWAPLGTLVIIQR